MNEFPLIILNSGGIVKNANDQACAITGVPKLSFIGLPLSNHFIKDHKVRFESELAAIVNNDEDHGRVRCTFIGLDDIGRGLTMRITKDNGGDIFVDLSSNIRSNRIRAPFNSLTLSNPDRLLPVALRISAFCRHAASKEELYSNCLAVLAEITSSKSAAALEWDESTASWPIISKIGAFDKTCLNGVFRSAVMGRLTRGDVTVKEAQVDGSQSNSSVILIPLMASKTPEGIVVLCVKGYSVLAPQEQQTLGMLGEIMGLGIRALSASNNKNDDFQPQTNDVESVIALGRLSAGLAHEINNATTILRNNVSLISSSARCFGRTTAVDSAVQDSTKAVEKIRDLTDALRAFAPEETRETEEINILRVIDMVASSVRFYAKRGIGVILNRPKQSILLVKCRSHYLIRSLFLIFVELIESAFESGREVNINTTIEQIAKNAIITIKVPTDPFNIPTVLFNQLERNGVLATHVKKAGAELAYDIQEDKLTLTIALPVAPESSSKTPLSLSGKNALSTRRGTILIVDDEPAIIRSTRRLLEMDHDVLAADSGMEALNIIKANPYIDVILMDVFMPQMTGIDVREELKKMHSPLINNIVFITAGATNQEVSKYLISSSAFVLEKPIDIAILNSVISNMIG